MVVVIIGLVAACLWVRGVTGVDFSSIKNQHQMAEVLALEGISKIFNLSICLLSYEEGISLMKLEICFIF